MYLGTKDFYLAQIEPNLSKFNHVCPHFASILPKFRPSRAAMALIVR